nr:MAG TPA: hypothetical protein [Caudoviricetes sp.]
MTAEKTTIALTERDKQVISLVSKLTDREVFGLECFLAGIRLREQPEQGKHENATA